MLLHLQNTNYRKGYKIIKTLCQKIQSKLEYCHLRNKKFVSYKNLKSFSSDLKEVYKATTEEAVLDSLEKFEEK